MDNKPSSSANDASIPENWYANTQPFAAVRHFARGDVLDATIQKFLTEQSIQTLDDLFKKCGKLVHLLKDEALSPLCVAVFEASRRMKRTADEILGGQVVFDAKCIPKGSLEMFSNGAVAVHPEKLPPQQNDRKQEFTLVLGPSGSGKTLFAIKRLPVLLVEGGWTKDVFAVHFQAIEAADVMKNDNLSFPDAVASVVKRKITKKLEEEKLTHINQFNMMLHVIVDEAGTRKEFFTSANAIRQIVNSVKENISSKFKAVHVTAVGTGLETSTADIDSIADTTKFRMQPWTIENFEALVAASDHPAKQSALAMVKKIPILQDLATNARCAYYLLRAMRDVWFLGKNRLKSMVNVLITSVADMYIMSNGLQILTTPQLKWQVARSVFVELDEASNNPGRALFPEFRDLDEGYRSIANCVLDRHVETRDQKLTFVAGNRYSLSMSPALVLVMVNLLNAEADISWDWEAFESHVMLSEMKRMVVKSTEVPKNLDHLCIQLQSPCPPSAATKNFSVPVVDRYKVVLNGPVAEYADVIAPYRLVKAMFSTNDVTSRELCLQDQLNKMGVTKSKDYDLQQTITNVLYTLWQKNVEAPPTASSEVIQPVNKDRRYECYPFNLINSRQSVQELAMVSGRKGNTDWEFSGGGTDSTTIITEFDTKSPVTAVFATNCEGFRLKRKNDDKTSLASITPDDVDCEGKLKEKTLPDYALRENVQVRFLFF